MSGEVDEALDAALKLLLELDDKLLLLLEAEVLFVLDNEVGAELTLLLEDELLAEPGGVGVESVFAKMLLTADQFPVASPALTPYV